MMDHTASRATTELSYNKGTSFMKNITAENNWTFGLLVGDVLTYVAVGFMQKAHFNQQHQNNDTLYRPSLAKAECLIGSENYLDAGKNCD